MMPKSRRTWLWAMLLILIAVLMAAMVWLVGRYEQSRFEDQLSTAAQRVSGDIQTQLQRHLLRVRALQQLEKSELWHDRAQTILQTHPDIVRIERRDANLAVTLSASAPLQPAVAAPRPFAAGCRSGSAISFRRKT